MTELKVKMSEMADEYEYKTNHGRDCYNCNGYSDGLNEGFKAGFRAALELPEVQELVELLERSLEIRDFDAPEDAEVKALGERIGFGALLDTSLKPSRKGMGCE